MPVAAYEIWAQVDDRTGSYTNQEGQTIWPYDYKIIFRDEASRRVGSNFTIDYDGKRFIINGITHENEAHRKYVIARCTAIEIQ